MKEIVETIEFEIPLQIPSGRSLERIENKSIETHSDLASVSNEANNRERLLREEENRRREQEKIRLERQFSQD